MNTFGRDVADPDAPVDDPLALLDGWLDRPRDSEPVLMTLATSDAQGAPEARTVMLNGHDGDRLSFHSDLRASKVAQLTDSPRATVVVLWADEARQLVASGEVVRAGEDEAARMYAACARDLQLLAWMNDPEIARLPRAERRARWRAFDDAHPELIPPPTWVCCHLVADRLTFWRGDDEGPSTRDEYVRSGGGWASRRLPG